MPLTYVEEAVQTALAGNAAIIAVCGGRVYPLQIPQGKLLPAVVYQRVATSPDTTLQGYQSESVTIMVNSFALKFSDAKALAKAVRAAMAGAAIKAKFLNEQDIINDSNGTSVFCVSAEFACQQTGGYCYG